MSPVAGPKPRPADIPDPVPGGAEQSAVPQGVPVKLTGGAPTPAAPTAPNPATPTPTDASSPDTAQTPQSGQYDSLFNEIDNPPNAPTDALFDEVTKNAQAQVEPGGTGAPFIPRAAAGLGRTLDEKRQLLQKALGNGYDTLVKGDKNGKNEQVLFRKKGDEKYHEMSPSVIDGAKNFVSQMSAGNYADALRTAGDLKENFGKSVTADITGDLIQGLFAGGGEVIGGTVGALAGTTAMGPGGGTLIGFGGGVLAGAAAGGGMAALAEHGLLTSLGIDPQVDLKKDAAFNALVNVGTLGLGAIAKRPLAGAFNLINGALAETKTARQSSMAKIREGIESFRSELNFLGPVDKNAQVSKAEFGEAVTNAADALKERLNTQIGAVEGKAILLGKDRTFPVENFMGRAQEIMNEQGVTFNADGKARLPGAKTIHDMNISLGADLGTGAQNMEIPLRLTEIEPSLFKPFGVKEGSTALGQIVSDYNNIHDKGGLGVPELLNMLSFYKKPAGFDKPQPNEVNSVYKRLRGALADDRNGTFAKLLKDTPEGEFSQSAYQNYRDHIEGLSDLKDMALRKGSPEKFADALIEPNNSQGAYQLKGLFGEDSPEWNATKAAWYEKILSKSLDPETGVLSGAAMKRELSSYGDDVVGAMLSPEQTNRLKSIATRAEKINFSDLIKNPQGSAFVKDVVKANISDFHSTESKVRVLWNLLSSDRAVMDRMTNHGLLEIAAETSDPAGRTSTLKAIDWLRKMSSIADLEVAKNGTKKLVLPLELPAISAIINAQERKPDEGLPAFLTRKEKAQNEVRHSLRIQNPEIPMAATAQAPSAALPNQGGVGP